MILADKIMELRKKAGWSQEEFAAQLGVSRSTAGSSGPLPASCTVQSWPR